MGAEAGSRACRSKGVGLEGHAACLEEAEEDVRVGEEFVVGGAEGQDKRTYIVVP